MNNFNRLKKTLGRWFSFPWYPLLFGAYPVLALLAFNAGQIKVEAGWRPLLVCVWVAALLFLLLRLILRDWQRAAFLSTLWMALFFSYGHIHILLTEKLKDFNFTSWLLLAWLVLAILAAVGAVRKSPSSALALNVIALGLVVTVLVQINPNVQKGGVHS